MAKNKPEKQRGWLNKSEMADSLGISTQAFDKWGVNPVARIGREALFDARSVLDNRLRKADTRPQLSSDIDPMAEQKLTQERLRLTSAQAEAQEFKNEVSRRVLIPAGFIAFAFSKLVPEISSTLDTLPMVVRRRHPELEPRHIDTLEREATKIRNACAKFASILPELIDEYLDSTE